MAKEKKKEKVAEKVEREFTVNLQEAYNYARPKRAKKALFFLRKFAFKHFRAAGNNVLISNAVNEFLWKQGREHVPRKIEVKIVFADGKANIFLKGEKIHLPKEKKEEKPKAAEKKTGEEKAAEEEKEKRQEEKKMAEKAAEKAAIKKGRE
ncbi:MAG: 50S ribosomal protein L31e [archaeon]